MFGARRNLPLAAREGIAYTAASDISAMLKQRYTDKLKYQRTASRHDINICYARSILGAAIRRYGVLSMVLKEHYVPNQPVARQS